MPKRITMADVARDAGVSMMTVSRVLNNKGEISEETRNRILNVIEELGYRRSDIARSLATNHTGTIGLVVPDIANPFFAEVAQGVENCASSRNYNIFLCNTGEDKQRELRVLGSLLEKQVDGIILCSSRLEEDRLVKALSSQDAIILVNRRSKADQFGAVLLDDILGGYLATNHLIRTGHREIGWLGGPTNSFSSQNRYKGYKKALKEAGIKFNPNYVITSPPTIEGGRETTSYLLSSQPKLSALFCYNDLVSIGSIQSIRERGLKIPEDIAIVGYDDIPLASLVTPSLTTCHIPKYDLGSQAMKLLSDRIAGIQEGPIEYVIEPRLVIRSSAP